MAGWPVAPGSGVSFGGSLFHLGEHLGPGFPGAVAVYIGNAVTGRSCKTPYMPDVGFHVFVVRECRDWPNVLGLQAIAGRVPGQFFEDHQTESPDAALCLRRCGWLGLAKAFWNSGSACMNLMRATFARAACGMSSRFASPRLILRSKDFRAESWPGLKYLWCSWFLATSSRAPQPQQHSGCASDSFSKAAVARLFSQAFRIASLRGVAGRFSFSDCSVVILPLKTAKIFGHKITWGSLWSRLLLRP